MIARKTAIAGMVLTLALWMICPVQAAQFHITTSQEFQAALTAAAGNGQNDTVFMALGTYAGQFEYQTNEANSLTIKTEDGTDSGQVILDAQGAGRVLYLDAGDNSADFVLKGITLQNGKADGGSSGRADYSDAEDKSIGSVLKKFMLKRGKGGIGGGLYLKTSGSADISNCAFMNNSASTAVGGVYIHSEREIALENNVIIKNSASEAFCGGAYVQSDTITLTNNVIAENSALYTGGLYITPGSQLYLINNTVTGNVATNAGGIYFDPDASAILHVYNNIIWGNSGGDVYLLDLGATKNSYNNDYHEMVGEWDAESGNIDGEPLFADPLNDYHLLDGSPCIDTGTPDNAPDADIEGNLRGPEPDIGAYERYTCNDDFSIAAYYPFNSNANDESQSGNHGKVEGATLTTDRFGNSDSAYTFDGTDDKITVPHNDSFNGDTGLTISLWIRFPDTPPNRVMSFVSKTSSSQRDGYIFPYLYGDDEFGLAVHTSHDGWGDYKRSFSYRQISDPSDWHFYATTFNRNRASLYVDGKLVSVDTRKGVITSNVNDLVFGNQAGFNEWAYADMDDVRIYKCALDDDQILELYSSEKPFLLLDPSSLNIPETGGEVTVDVVNVSSGGIAWEVTEDESDWFSVNPDSGINSGTITVTYDANDSGEVRTGIITVGPADSSQTVTARLVQVAESLADISASPEFYDFGPIYTGASSPSQIFTVSNTGSVSLDISSTTRGADASEFRIREDNCSGKSVLPSESCPVQVVFNPSSAGTKNAVLNISSSDKDTPTVSIVLKGTGYADLVSPANLEAQAGKDSVKLTWEPGATLSLIGYNVYRSTVDEASSYMKINENLVTGAYYMDTIGEYPSPTYYYYVTAVTASGEESDPSEKVSVAFGQIKLFIPDSRGGTGREVILPVNIANADGLNICAADISVTYDPTVLTAKGIEKTALTADYEWASNLGTEGEVRASIAVVEGTTLYGEGSLFYLLFDVKGDEGAKSDIKFSDSKIFLYDCDDLFNAMLIGIDDSGIFTVDANYILGDFDGNGIVDEYDAGIALDIAVGNIPINPVLLDIGDVNGDGRIGPSDMALIMRIAFGSSLAPESSRTGRSASRSSSVTVSVPDDVAVYLSDSIWVPIEIDDATDVAGATVVLNYNPSLFVVAGVRTTSLTENFDLRFNIGTPGQVRISCGDLAGKGLDAGSGVLLEVQFFTTRSDISEYSSSSPVTLASVSLNDTYSRDFATSALQMDVKTDHGSLRATAHSPGDIDHSTVVDLGDVILALKVSAGMDIQGIYSDADVSGDKKIGLEEAVYVLQVVGSIGD